MFKLAIEICFENHFGFDSRYILIARVDQIRILFLGHPVYINYLFIFNYLLFIHEDFLQQNLKYASMQKIYTKIDNT